MKKEKLNLGAIEIRSFQTSLDHQKSQTIKGGQENSACRTLCFFDCESGQNSGCMSCGGTGGGGTGGSGATCDTLEFFSCQYPC